MLFGKEKLNWRSGVGELFIIVFGVLIALWAENLREGFQDRALERDYLERLAEDLRMDSVAISEMMELSVARAAHAETVLAALESGVVSIAPRQFLQAVEHSWFFGYPSYTRTTVDDLMSTGNLRLIKDETVKAEISGYYALIDGIGQFRDVYVPTQQEISRILPSVLELEQRFSVFDNLPEGYESPFPWAADDYAPSAEEADLVLTRLAAYDEVPGLYSAMARTQGRHHANLGRIKARAIALLNTLEEQAR